MTELGEILNESVGQEDDCEPLSFTARIEAAQRSLDAYDAVVYPQMHALLAQRLRNLLDARREANQMEQRWAREFTEFRSSDLFRDEMKAAREARAGK